MHFLFGGILSLSEARDYQRCAGMCVCVCVYVCVCMCVCVCVCVKSATEFNSVGGHTLGRVTRKNKGDGSLK